MPLPHHPGRIVGPALLLIALLANSANAHDFWLESEGNSYVLYQGHRHSAHGGEERVAYDPAIVKSVLCIDGAGRARQLAASGQPLRFSGDCAAIDLALRSGYWTKTPWDTVNQPKSAVKGALESWLAEENLHHLVRHAPAPQAPSPQGLALRLLSDPARLQSGDKFRVLALLDGRPHAGVAVAYAGETRGLTDAEGRINLRLRQGGRQMISASLATALNDGQADTHLRVASLSFFAP